MHALRHFYASVLLDAGESIKAVSEYLGHSDPGLTLRVYARTRCRRARGAVRAASGACRADRGPLQPVARMAAMSNWRRTFSLTMAPPSASLAL